MANTKQIENNVIESFQLAKKDISILFDQVAKLRKELSQLNAARYELSLEVKKLSSKRKVSRKKVSTKTKSKPSVSKKYVASKKGKKVHNPNCFFASNIDKENRVVFNTKTKALNEGFRLCSCLAY